MSEPLKISYVNCNKHTILLIIIFIPCLIATEIFVKLSVYGDYYQKQKQYSQYCIPANFFWGNDIPCKKFIHDVVKNKNENFTVLESTNSSISIKEINPLETTKSEIKLNNDIFKYNIFKETVINNYLAIIDLIHSFNEFILLVLLKISGNIINRIIL